MMSQGLGDAGTWADYGVVGLCLFGLFGFVASAAVWMFRTVGKMLDRAELDRQAYMTSQQRCAEDHREERREWLASAEANQTAMRAAVDRLTDAIERKGV